MMSIGKWQGSILGEFLLESSGESYRQRHTVAWGQPSSLYRWLIITPHTHAWTHTHTRFETMGSTFLLPPENQAGGWLERERETRVACVLGKLTVDGFL